MDKYPTTARVNAMGEERRGFVPFMLEHACLSVIKEHIDAKGQDGGLNSFPPLRGEYSEVMAAVKLNHVFNYCFLNVS